VVAVKAVRLDSFLKQQNVSNVDLLKIDVEGADFLVLESFNWEKYRPEVVMVEFMDSRSQKNFNYDHHAMVRFMDKIGYVAYTSEWAPIVDYYSPGKVNKPHQWIRLKKYSPNDRPDWGNLIFIPVAAEAKFYSTARKYILGRQFVHVLLFPRRMAAKIPFLKKVYRAMKRNG
jgi:hypothetical protein